jgi:hypothetical protein
MPSPRARRTLKGLFTHLPRAGVLGNPYTDY